MIRFLALALALISGKAFKCMRLRMLLAVCALLHLPWTAALANSSAALTISDSDQVFISGVAHYWYEKSAKLGIEQVAAANHLAKFSPLAKEAMFDLQIQDRLWIRIDLDRKSQYAGHWILWVPLPLIDTVSLYQLKADGSWQALRAGDRVAVANWPEPGRYPRFHLEIPSGKSSLYIQVQTSTPLSLPLHIGTEVSAQAADRQGFLYMGLIVGVLLTLVLVCMVTAYTYRDQLYLLYGLYMLLMILAVSSYAGVAGYLIWDHSPKWTDASQGILALLTAGGTLYFIEALLGGRQFAKRLSAALLILGASAFPLSVLYYFLSRPNGVIVLGIYLVVITSIGLSLALRAWRRGDQVGKWVFIAYTPLALAVMSAVARAYGWVSVSWVVQYGVIAALMIEAPMMMIALHVRSRERHEISTREQAMSTQDALTGLFTEIIFDDRIRQTMTRYSKHQENAAIVLISLVNYDAISNAYGLPVAEQSILRAVIKLRRVLRDADTVARVGTSQFGVIMEGENERKHITELGARLIAQGLMPLPGLVPEVILQFHVTAVVLRELPHADIEIKQNLQALLSSMSSRTRRPIRFLDLKSPTETSAVAVPASPSGIDALAALDQDAEEYRSQDVHVSIKPRLQPEADSSLLGWQSTEQELVIDPERDQVEKPR